MRVICVIPARGGSKRIKNKNILKINSEPLINLVLKNIVKSKIIDRIVVFTNSKNIKKTVFKLKKNNKIFVNNRSKKSERDAASTESLLNEINHSCEFDIAIMIQITNPFINYKIVDKALKRFIRLRYDSMLSVVPMKSFIWEKKGKVLKPKNYKISKRPRSQEIDEYFLENGSFYIYKKKNYLKYRNRLGGKIGFFAMNKESIFEIDEFSDLEIIKRLIK